MKDPQDVTEDPPDDRHELEGDAGMASGIYPEEVLDRMTELDGTRSDRAGEEGQDPTDSPERRSGYGRTLPGYTKKHEDAIEEDQQDMDVPPGGIKGEP